MWRVLGTAVCAAVTLIGLVLKIPWTVLDWTGRALTARDMNGLIDSIAAHPRIVVDYGPYVLWLGSAVTLIWIWGGPWIMKQFAPIRLILDGERRNGVFQLKGEQYTRLVKREGEDIESQNGRIYRIKLKNRSGRTVRNVHAILHHVGTIYDKVNFTRTESHMMDMHPGATEDLDMFWFGDITEADELFLKLIQAPDVRPLTLIVRGEGMREIQKKFVADSRGNQFVLRPL